jgi:hypothetical protein
MSPFQSLWTFNFGHDVEKIVQNSLNDYEYCTFWYNEPLVTIINISIEDDRIKR